MLASDETYDLAIIGGGINGAGIARDAAGRGWRVLLLEQDDLASATSSWSTKLIHGGLRYLEHFAFRLVRESLVERETLWGIAPHIITPLRIVLPHHEGLRPAWLLRLGLFLYDHIGGRRLLPATATLDLRSDPAGAALKPGFRRGFEYSDCRVDDSRLVVLNALDAAQHGADIRTRRRVIAARREAGLWRIDHVHARSGAPEQAQARALVNAAGPWVDSVLTGALGLTSPAKVRLVQGSHIVVRRLFAHDRAYIFQNADDRIIFAIPYEDDFTLIGTTDRDYAGDPAAVSATPDEIAYLCAAAGAYFAASIRPDDVVWAYSGVRPLYDDGASKAQEATRDYVLKRDAPSDGAPLLSVFGGKITTYRRLAEQAIAELALSPPQKPRHAAGWTARAPLPGGAFPVDGGAALVAQLEAAFPFLTRRTAQRLIRLYGTRATEMLGDARMASDLGTDFGAGLSAREIDWLRRHEWAQTADDILWRRTKLGLHLSATQRDAVRDHLATHGGPSR